MKKKIFISTFAIAAMALTAFTGYKTFGPKQSMSDLLLDENIEALTQGELKYGYIVKVVTNPLSDKKQITCLPNGYDGCSPSDF